MPDTCQTALWNPSDTQFLLAMIFIGIIRAVLSHPARCKWLQQQCCIELAAAVLCPVSSHIVFVVCLSCTAIIAAHYTMQLCCRSAACHPERQQRPVLTSGTGHCLIGPYTFAAALQIHVLHMHQHHHLVVWPLTYQFAGYPGTPWEQGSRG